jgi:hypothetical protein
LVPIVKGGTVQDEYLVRELSTGDVIVFVPESRDLYLIDASAREELEQGGGAVEAARELAAAGRAKHFDRGALRSLQDALAAVPLLEAAVL